MFGSQTPSNTHGIHVWYICLSFTIYIVIYVLPWKTNIKPACGTFGPSTTGCQVRHLPRAVQERVEHLMRDVEKWSLELQRKNAEDRDVMNLLKWIINRYEWWCYDFQQHIMCTVIRSAFCVVWFCFRKFDMWLFAKMLYPNGADSRGFPRYQDWNQCSSVLAKTSDCEAPCNMKWYGGSGWILYYDFIVVHGFRHVFNCVLACWQWSWTCWHHILRFRVRS